MTISARDARIRELQIQVRMQEAVIASLKEQYENLGSSYDLLAIHCRKLRDELEQWRAKYTQYNKPSMETTIKKNDS